MPPEFVLLLVGTPCFPLETARLLVWATAAHTYLQLGMPREGPSSLLGEQTHLGASQRCTAWIWVSPAEEKHGALGLESRVFGLTILTIPKTGAVNE